MRRAGVCSVINKSTALVVVVMVGPGCRRPRAEGKLSSANKAQSEARQQLIRKN